MQENRDGSLRGSLFPATDDSVLQVFQMANEDVKDVVSASFPVVLFNDILLTYITKCHTRYVDQFQHSCRKQ